MIEVGVVPFNLKNIFFQDGSVENTKPKAQRHGHQSPTP
jgi:prepilin-type processing-associated H-X9-DG protein